MAFRYNRPGKSPDFNADDLDWVMGELLHMIWQAKRVGMLPQDFNPLLFYRCMQVIGYQPLDVGLCCIQIINDTMRGFIAGHKCQTSSRQQRVALHEYTS